MLANMSIEPIITVYVAQIVPDPAQVTIVAGLVMSAAALGSILSASASGQDCGPGRALDGDRRLPAGAALLLMPQAFVTAGWQLIALRFLMGLSLGGLLPCVTTVIRHNVPGAQCGQYPGLFDIFAICRAGCGAVGGWLRRRASRHARGVPGHIGADGSGRGV